MPCSHATPLRARRAALLVLLLVSLAAGPGLAQPAKTSNAKTEAEIKALELELARLIMKGDADGYGKYLADDYLLINAAGSVVSKTQILEALKAGTTSDSLIPSD